MGNIYDELKQTRRFADPRQEAVIALLRTADVLRARVEAHLLPHGISPEQYNVLRILRGAPDRQLPTLEIASRMITRAPNITRLIDKLAAKKLVSRCDHKSDRRVVVVRLTPRGLDLVNEVSKSVDEIDARGLSALSKSQVETLIEILDAVRADGSGGR